MTVKTPNTKSILEDESYLDITYSVQRSPYGQYPDLLAQWIYKNIYKKSGHLLDIGCGRGEYLAAFSNLEFEVAGVDISPAAVTYSDSYDVRIANLETEALPFQKNSFDFVFTKSVIEHMDQPMMLFKEAFDVLRPGGVAVIMTPSWAHTYWGPFYIDHTHVTPFTKPSLSDAMTLAKFADVSVTHFYQLPFLWRYPLLKPLVKLWAKVPLPYRPYQDAQWSDTLNKLIRFSKEVMLLGVGIKEKI